METNENVENEEKKESRKMPVWASILLYILVLFICLVFFSGIAQCIMSLTVGENFEKEQFTYLMAMESSMLLSVLVSTFLMCTVERRPFVELGLVVKGHAKDLLYGTLVAVLLYMIGFGCSLALGVVKVESFHLDWSSLTISWIFFLMVALTEEIMVRGYVLGRLLQTRLNKFVSLFISSLFFAALHIFNPNVALLPMVNLLLAGMLLGASMLYVRNLCFPIALHLFWNWIQGPILGYQVSGNDFGTSLLKLHLSQANVLNGGAFGFEGSLICTVLMVVFTILIIWWGERREAINLVKHQSC